MKAKRLVGLHEYGSEMEIKMSEAWGLARQCIGKAQKSQKQYYDRKCRLPNFKVGERVFLYKPAEKTGEARKFARPYHGPFRILELDVNTARIRRVDRPQDEPILVALDRLRRCPDEIADEYWPPDKKKSKAHCQATVPSDVPLSPRPIAGANQPTKPQPQRGVVPTSTNTTKTKASEGENLETMRMGGTRVDVSPTSVLQQAKTGGMSGGKWAGRLRSSRKKSDEDA